VYSLVYDKHRGWYSWLLSMLTGYIYAFGFVMMCPQLFINYRLKSVAHLPWRALCYKVSKPPGTRQRACAVSLWHLFTGDTCNPQAFNTFIDDVFAFIIHMPTMHRIACFRDDRMCQHGDRLHATAHMT
jgi:hypothetical protein